MKNIIYVVSIIFLLTAPAFTNAGEPLPTTEEGLTTGLLPFGTIGIPLDAFDIEVPATINPSIDVSDYVNAVPPSDLAPDQFTTAATFEQAIENTGKDIQDITIAVVCTETCNFGDVDDTLNIIRVDPTGIAVNVDGNPLDINGNSIGALGNVVDADGIPVLDVNGNPLNPSVVLPPAFLDPSQVDISIFFAQDNLFFADEFAFANILNEAIFRQIIEEQAEALEEQFADLGLDGDLSALTTPESEALTIGVAERTALDAGLEGWRINFRKMTTQLNTGMIAQVEAIGMFFDAKHQLESQRIFQKRTAQAHKDYHPSEQMCEIGTFVRNLAKTERNADITKAVLNNQMIDRALGTGNVKTIAGNESDEISRRENYITTYCDIQDNAIQNEFLCRGTNADKPRRSIDVNYTNLIDVPLTLDVNYNDPTVSPTEEDIFSFLDNIFLNDAFPFDSQQKANNQNYILPYEDKRSLIAMRSVAHNTFSNIIAQKTQSPASPASATPYMFSLMREMGILDELIIAELGENPSYWAQMEVLTKKVYQNPDFITNLYDKPANVKRIRASMAAIKSMQDRDINEAMMRREMLLSMILELQLRKKQKNIDDEFSNFTFSQ